MKNIIYTCLSFGMTFISQVASASLRNDIIPDQNATAITATEDGTGLLDAVLLYIKDSIFALMALIAIAVFLWIWGRLIIARWNPEEFKKALMSLVYAIVWIFIVAFAWAAVRLVAGLTF